MGMKLHEGLYAMLVFKYSKCTLRYSHFKMAVSKSAFAVLEHQHFLKLKAHRFVSGCQAHLFVPLRLEQLATY